MLHLLTLTSLVILRMVLTSGYLELHERSRRHQVYNLQVLLVKGSTSPITFRRFCRCYHLWQRTNSGALIEVESHMRCQNHFTQAFYSRDKYIFWCLKLWPTKIRICSLILIFTYFTGKIKPNCQILDLSLSYFIWFLFIATCARNKSLASNSTFKIELVPTNAQCS